MKTIKGFILENNIKTFYKEYFKTHNFNDWLYEVYDSENISEIDYYLDKYIYENYTWDIPHYKLWQDLIYERLGDSFKLTEKNIQDIKNFKGIEKIKVINRKNFKFIIKVNNDFNENDFNTLMNFYGYVKDKQASDNKSLYMYEAIKPEKINKKFNYVYHVTHKSAYEKIKKFGLIPKQKHNHHSDWVNNDKKSFEYPNRIYVFSEDTNFDVIERFAKLNNKIHNRDINDIIILKVKVPEYIVFYGDPAFNIDNAMFTMEPIQTKYIEKIK